MVWKQRELKFRAWDGEDMICPEVVCGWGAARWRANSIPQDSGVHGYPVMQYTGLTDKNGVEIFEGDIIRQWGCCPGGRASRTRVVEWTSSCGCCYTVYGWEDFEDGEVIGNCFEHPHLLEGENE